MNENYFTTFQDAKTWALKSSNNVFVRSADGNGFTSKNPVSKPKPKPVDVIIYNPTPPESGKIGQLYMLRKITRKIAESMVDSATKMKLDEIIRSGDELWLFTNSGQDWDNLAGQSGFSVIRNNEIIYKVVTEMS